MKFLHLADLHLRKSLGNFDLTEDQRYILDRITETARDRQADAVVISGDVYDKSIPSEAAVNILDKFLSDLSKLDIKVFMISGNHDSDDRLNFGSGLFAQSNIYISAKYSGSLYRQTVSDEFGEVDFYLLPFVKASQVRHFFPDAEIEDYDDAVRKVIGAAGIDPSRRNVIAAHQFVVSGTSETVLGGSESLGTRMVGTVEKIDSGVFDCFDYAALGHIHSAQGVGRDTVRYSGSPLKYSLSEVNNAKSVPLVTLGEKGDVSVALIPLKPLRDLRHITGKMADLLDRANVTDNDDYIYVTLTDEDMTGDAMTIFQQTYPNTVKVTYENSHTVELDHVDISAIAENRTFDELISDFYREMYGTDISPEEMAVMRQTAREAGVLDETD